MAPTRNKKEGKTPDQVILEIILQNLSATEEGARLVEFAREKNIGFDLTWSSPGPAVWVPQQNKIVCNYLLSGEEAIAALSHTLRQAMQSYQVPGLHSHSKIEMAAQCLQQQALILRLAQADAYSYSLAMRTQLERETGYIKNAAASMAALPLDAVQALEAGKAPLLPPLRLEIYVYAKEFSRKFGDAPFSAAARADAFRFFQSSLLFKSGVDENLGLLCAVPLSLRQTFWQVAPCEKLRSVPEAAALIATCTADPASGVYLNAAALQALEDTMQRQMSPKLKDMLGPWQAPLYKPGAPK